MKMIALDLRKSRWIPGMWVLHYADNPMILKRFYSFEAARSFLCSGECMSK